jgi:hypothetical protein
MVYFSILRHIHGSEKNITFTSIVNHFLTLTTKVHESTRKNKKYYLLLYLKHIPNLWLGQIKNFF